MSDVVGIFEHDVTLHYVSEDIVVSDGLVVFRKPGEPSEEDMKKARRAVRMVDMHLTGLPEKRKDGLWQQRVLNQKQ
jgi:hypothetical protein